MEKGKKGLDIPTKIEEGTGSKEKKAETKTQKQKRKKRENRQYFSIKQIKFGTISKVLFWQCGNAHVSQVYNIHRHG